MGSLEPKGRVLHATRCGSPACASQSDSGEIMITRTTLAVTTLAVAVIVSGCSSQVVRCDGKLSPINAPAPDKTTQVQPKEAKP
jgi:hypothetical protein